MPAAVGGNDEGGGLFAADQSAGELLIGGDIEDDDFEELDLSIDDEDAPIRVDKAVKNAFGEPIRRRKNKLGPGYLHMPDFKNITGVGSTTRSRDTSNNPFESLENSFADLLNDDIGFSTRKPHLSVDVIKTLSSLENVISNSSRVLSENDLIDPELLPADEEDQNGTP